MKGNTLVLAVKAAMTVSIGITDSDLDGQQGIQNTDVLTAVGSIVQHVLPRNY